MTVTSVRVVLDASPINESRKRISAAKPHALEAQPQSQSKIRFLQREFFGARLCKEGLGCFLA
jgi:hypothetical protein